MSHVSVFFFFAGIQLLSCFTCPDSIGGGGACKDLDFCGVKFK